MKESTVKVLGINFFNGTTLQVLDIMKKGGLMVVPAAPALINITKDPSYYQSVLDADVVIPDSGFMSLIWNIKSRNKINRISGLEFLEVFLNDKQVQKSTNIMLINPRKGAASSNISFLQQLGFNVTEEDSSYIAPLYDKTKVEDELLLGLVKAKKPDFIIINLGGGTQEKLGANLKNNLDYSPAIICTGAAIAFLTGEQAKIPKWADRFFLGWLFRCFENPKQFIPRYWEAFKLFPLMLKYGKKTPKIRGFYLLEERENWYN